jgi:hypothetical protein
MTLQNSINKLVNADKYRYEFYCDFEATEALDMISGIFSRDVSGTSARGNNSNATANRPGIHSVETGTTATGRAAYRTNTAAYGLGGGIAQFMTDIAIPTLSDATNTFTVRSGLINSGSGDGTDGVFFRYTNGTNSGNWQAVCRANSTETVINSSVAVAVGAFASGTPYKLEFVANADASSIEFFINGSSIGSITTNIPTAANGKFMGWVPVSIVKTVGTTNRTVLIDRTSLKIDFTTLRP